jgi:hypothetical protein
VQSKDLRSAGPTTIPDRRSFDSALTRFAQDDTHGKQIDMWMRSKSLNAVTLSWLRLPQSRR